MAKTNNLTDFLTDVANTIRTKKGYASTKKINPQDFSTEISGISTVKNYTISSAITPTESAQTFSVPSGYTGYAGFSVSAVSDTYIGSKVARKGASDLTSSVLTVTVPAGYYSSQATKSCSDSNLSAANIKKNVTIFGVKGTYDNYDPNAGYQSGYDAGNSAGQAAGKANYEPTSATITNAGSLTVKNAAGTSVYAATISPNYNGGYSAGVTQGESNITSKFEAKTGINPTESSQTITPSTGKSALSSVQINGISSTYVGSGVTKKDESTYHPSKTTDQTISSGQYLSGTQTIKAVSMSNIVAGNIKHGVTIKVGDSDDSERLASVTGSFYNDGGTYTLSSVGTRIDMGSTSSNRYITTSGLYKPSTVISTATTYTPGTTNQTIASGTYFNEVAGTIKGDANLLASNIKKDVTIFNVKGTYAPSAPSLQAKTGINPSTSSQTIRPDSGYDGLSSVQINAMKTSSNISTATGTLQSTIAPSSTAVKYVGVTEGYTTAKYWAINKYTEYAGTGRKTSSSISRANNYITITAPSVATLYHSEQTDINDPNYGTIIGECNISMTVTPQTMILYRASTSSTSSTASTSYTNVGAGVATQRWLPSTNFSSTTSAMVMTCYPYYLSFPSTVSYEYNVYTWGGQEVDSGSGTKSVTSSFCYNPHGRQPVASWLSANSSYKVNNIFSGKGAAAYFDWGDYNVVDIPVFKVTINIVVAGSSVYSGTVPWYLASAKIAACQSGVIDWSYVYDGKTE